MTERKPAGMSWESFADRQFREAEERGEFKDLPGFGKPLPGAGEEYDELWWVKSKLQREGLSLLPPSLALRKEVEVARERIPSAPSEAAVRRLVEELNAKIVDVNARTFDGPPSNVYPLGRGGAGAALGRGGSSPGRRRGGGPARGRRLRRT